jgi:Double zinc ribbon
MALCGHCGDTVSEGSLSCPTCGEPMDNSIPCAGCGFPVQRGAASCPSCGRHLGQPYAYRTSRLKLQSSAGDVGVQTALDCDAANAWPPSEHRKRSFGLVSLGAKRTDPLFLAALLCAVASLVFSWAPRYNVSLACVALSFSLMGYQHYFSYKHRGRYGGLWLNYLATVVGTCALVAAVGVSAFIA